MNIRALKLLLLTKTLTIGPDSVESFRKNAHFCFLQHKPLYVKLHNWLELTVLGVTILIQLLMGKLVLEVKVIAKIKMGLIKTFVLIQSMSEITTVQELGMVNLGAKFIVNMEAIVVPLTLAADVLMELVTLPRQ